MPHAEVGGGSTVRSGLPHASIPKHATALATRASRVEEHLQAQVDAAVTEPPSTTVSVDGAREVRNATCRPSRIHVGASRVTQTASVQDQGRMRFPDVPIAAASVPSLPRTMPTVHIKTNRLFLQTSPNAASVPISVCMDLTNTTFRGKLQADLIIRGSVPRSSHDFGTFDIRAIMFDVFEFAFAFRPLVMFLVFDISTCKQDIKQGTRRMHDISQVAAAFNSQGIEFSDGLASSKCLWRPTTGVVAMGE